MVLFPLGTFYFLFYVYFKQDKDMLGWCGMAAVLAANLVIAAYVRMAWMEDRDEMKEKNIRAKLLAGHQLDKRTD